MRAVLVCNPESTTSTSSAVREVLINALGTVVTLDVAETQYPEHALEIARQAAVDRIDFVVAHGGDGTVNEVVNGLLSEAPHGVDAQHGHLPVLG